ASTSEVARTDGRTMNFLVLNKNSPITTNRPSVVYSMLHQTPAFVYHATPLKMFSQCKFPASAQSCKGTSNADTNHDSLW
ncbi:MAG: hypothetical protein L0Z53_00590, partial [Acidobacteriales bacterium]|nr:hypothetical protein [Terriglobales bacterium]